MINVGKKSILKTNNNVLGNYLFQEKKDID
jgi:hypothetical protein